MTSQVNNSTGYLEIKSRSTEIIKICCISVIALSLIITPNRLPLTDYCNMGISYKSPCWYILQQTQARLGFRTTLLTFRKKINVKQKSVCSEQIIICQIWVILCIFFILFCFKNTRINVKLIIIFLIKAEHFWHIQRTISQKFSRWPLHFFV